MPLWKALATTSPLARKVITLLYVKLKVRPPRELIRVPEQAKLVSLLVRATPPPHCPLPASDPGRALGRPGWPARGCPQGPGPSAGPAPGQALPHTETKAGPILLQALGTIYELLYVPEYRATVRWAFAGILLGLLTQLHYLFELDAVEGISDYQEESLEVKALSPSR